MAKKKQEELNKMEEKVQEEKTTKTTKTKYKTKKQLKRNMLVPVMNYTNGILVYTSPKSGATWRFEGFGAEDEMELSELMTMRSGSPKFLNEPWMIILDDEVIEYLGLTKMYENILSAEEINNLFQISDKDFEDFMERVPSGIQQLITSKASEMVKQNKFESLIKKNIIEKIMNVELDS